nr:transcriptional regulator [Desulfobacula sp.]
MATVDPELLNIIMNMDDVDELKHFFEDLFTPAELDDISLRWKLLKDLYEGLTQRKIADKYGISLCKITRGSRILKKKDSIVRKLLNAQQSDKRQRASEDHNSKFKA